MNTRSARLLRASAGIWSGLALLCLIVGGAIASGDQATPFPGAGDGDVSHIPSIVPTLAGDSGFNDDTAGSEPHPPTDTPVPTRSPSTSNQPDRDVPGSAVKPTPAPTVSPAGRIRKPNRASTPTLAGDEITVTCDQPNLLVAPGSFARVTCSVVTTGMRDTPITITGILVSVPGGWAIASDLGTVDGSVLSIVPAGPLTSDHADAFAFMLSPTCAASTTAQAVTLTSTLSAGDADIAGPTTTLSVGRSNAASISASIVRPPDAMSAGFSPDPQAAPAALAFDVTAAGCDGWAIELSATDFAYSGAANGADIPSANFGLASSSLISRKGDTSGMTAAQSGSLGEPVTVLSAEPGRGNGDYEQTLNLVLTVPDGAVPGTYRSTVTISVLSAP